MCYFEREQCWNPTGTVGINLDHAMHSRQQSHITSDPQKTMPMKSHIGSE